MTTNHILAIEAVTAEGDIIRLGNPAGEMIGMDLIGVIVGSEGTFAIVTEITVRLLPKPQAVKTMLAAFHSVEECSQTVSDVIAAGDCPLGYGIRRCKDDRGRRSIGIQSGIPARRGRCATDRSRWI